LKLKPSNAAALFADAVAYAVGGGAIEPLSIVSATSVLPSPEVRLVMLTDRNSVRLPVTFWLAVPPEQLSTISPNLSAKPSAFTGVGTALLTQVIAAFAADTTARSPGSN